MNAFRVLLGLLMLAFIGVQYNDPDGPLWVLIYGVPALAMGIGVWRPDWMNSRAGRTLVTLAVVALAIAAIVAWPRMPGFWRQDVWWEEETAREGMGLMIACLVTAVALPVAWNISWRGRAGRLADSGSEES